MGRLVGAVAALLLLAATANGALMSIDLGSEYLKVCLVKPGRTPISIAVNEMSEFCPAECGAAITAEPFAARAWIKERCVHPLEPHDAMLNAQASASRPPWWVL